MDNLKQEFGKHYLVELIGCDKEKIKFVKDVEEPFLQAAKKSGTKILKYLFHQFQPYGVTGVVVISWSHFAIHTWPEADYIALDILTCGEMDAQITIDDLKKKFRAKEARVKVIPRGV
ncbi:MAG: adenosylmethionine decarboxylase [Candidatus Omnitrophica bacterium]|nr:adenosylmethionine decarboxylase [Candidatus Omnitrophota bacterium]